jgi:putative aminopeptidase FrvX
MDKTGTLKMIAEISDTKGVSGFEDEVVTLLRKYCEDLGTINEDKLRNLYVDYVKNTGDRPVVLLDAHSDEVGFMVQAVKPCGTLQVVPIGSLVAHNMAAQKVWVRNMEGEYLPGVTEVLPPEYRSEAEKNEPLAVKQISVDIGAVSLEEALTDFKIRIGEPIVPCAKFEYNEKQDIMFGKAFDCRIGCAAVISTLKSIKDLDLKIDIIAAFSSQEEVGTRGAAVTSREIKPDIAIVFEGSPADDTYLNPYEAQTALKKGPMLRHIDSKMITNPRYQRHALSVAAGKQIPVQEAVRSAGATNSATIHLNNEGIPTIVLGIPVRYTHTSYGLASYSDYENSVKLACEILKSLDAEMINRL